MRSWRSLDALPHHLPFDVDFLCPLAFRHKKGEYIVECLFLGGEYCWLELVEFRLYLGASHCIFIFLALAMFFDGIFMLGGVFLLL